ncbi:MAG: MerR family transcriptional regulator [Furfurilactobacillus sp.]|jgi:DNA-binding transcriptional MerR regulator|uniref:MerR family transcriptional regulator n=1 Tax=Furfurilactobacillus sp. TaxID=2767911 RepID=UPI00258B0E9F|nr:MerR family transcriptional regulator [Furfurilactobacillus sp.]MCH4011772.1 MerR family transcriptional regulator [Furfurilactobacillus sp.]MCH4037664.1 MerR family transcriptional regulator [Furfurilactobacillus sp.]MCH4115700.1 MerR family transcriptional regulator [Furfurilactobacillus sp.]MCI1339686.1 MerR family transcriptional regulator [Furfurilactobacillus sp.]MCI1386857.1 MerR family transcriptional regulator [Furfurilactobacillus sp.]
MYSIGEFSKLVGMPTDTLRYYEKLDLITPARSHTNKREYSDADIQWIAFIKRLKSTGMPMKQIQAYAQLRDIGDATIDGRLDLLAKQRLRLKGQQQLIQQHLDFLDQKIDSYHQRKQQLNQN